MVESAAIMPKLRLLTRIAITLTLAIFQFIHFGMPAWEKYSRAAVGEAKMIEKHDSLRSPVDPFEPPEDGLRPPAITLCPFKHNFKGWKQATKEDRGVDDQSYNQCTMCILGTTMALWSKWPCICYRAISCSPCSRHRAIIMPL